MGTSGTAYRRTQLPWGNQEETERRCNMDDSGLAAPQQSVSFPAVTLSGAADMAGNVWEWCSTRWQEDYNNYERTVSDDFTVSEIRVLRGGSFVFDRVLVRCAARFRGYPGHRNRSFGFRVVVSPGF
ncbi:MAG: SUMF1/EgtB/PvdO family nonheme iron enzyme [Caldilineaceae bacterium]